MANIDLDVKGMTCGHCVMSVTEELSEIGTVESVNVDLSGNADVASKVHVSTTGDVSDDELRDAIVEAGFELAGINR
ncbi:heavy-metal-associated domain-containing protein [Gleimia europaea]|uniref:HMA domain-containing protein n=1 Tax=Gleimia europaea ACS-120-V-Col10b TaxID=883069 RepID=A0A9W5RF48_9ACTO|nr:cation transporter [Gleimia europaea]EPD31271.1 hypothetical protein HMPREF9238_01039 [Gleimia europaea ACS-120-V-Col10b]